MNRQLRGVRLGLAVMAIVAMSTGTAASAKILLTGADIQDDSLTGADILESSLAMVPTAANAVNAANAAISSTAALATYADDATKLGGKPASAYLPNGAAAGGALDGTYPNPGIADGAVTTSEIANGTVGMADLATGAVSAPKLLDGAAATNIWGHDQWAPPNATERGYLEIRLDDTTGLFADGVGGFGSISYPVPLAPDASWLDTHVILDGDPVPDGCGGSYGAPMATRGNLCVFYRPAYKGDSLAEVTPPSSPEARFGHLFRADLGHDTSGNGCDCVVIDLIWAMTPPSN